MIREQAAPNQPKL